MTDEDSERNSLRHTIIAWREARDVSKPGLADYLEFDQKMKHAWRMCSLARESETH